MTLDRVLVRKAALDAGFDLEHPPDGPWARFGISGQPLTAWVRPLAAGFQLALSARRVLDELEARELSDHDVPVDAAGCFHVASYQSLMATLARARILDATLPTRLYDHWQARMHGLTTTERDVLAKQRVGQDLFREGLMAYWRGRCAVTGLAVRELLVASHIVPWSMIPYPDPRLNDLMYRSVPPGFHAHRLDARNGIALNALHDKAFDGGFITFDRKLRMVCCKQLRDRFNEPEVARNFKEYKGKPLIVPKGSEGPNLDFLEWHRGWEFRD